MPIVQFLIQAKWEAYGARMAFYEGALHIVMVAAYMTYGGMLPTAIYVPAPGAPALRGVCVHLTQRPATPAAALKQPS